MLFLAAHFGRGTVQTSPNRRVALCPVRALPDHPRGGRVLRTYRIGCAGSAGHARERAGFAERTETNAALRSARRPARGGAPNRRRQSASAMVNSVL